MPQTFPPLADLASYPQLTIAEFAEHFPDVEERENEECDDDDYFDDEEELGNFQARWQEQTIVLIEGDVYISSEQVTALREKHRDVLLAIDGDVEFEGDAAGLFYVSGDVLCREIRLDKEWLHVPVGGKIIARDSAWLLAEDHEVICASPYVTLQTPMLFSWFYSLDNLQLEEDTAVFILADWDYCGNLAIPNPIFRWHHCIYVLKDEFVYAVDCESSDASIWRCWEIGDALAAGQNVYRDGFNLACMTYQTAADDALRMRQYQQAYLGYKKSAEISPTYYFAWYGMGEALFDVGAYEQALAAYQAASKLFPAKQTGLVNEALNNAALCALLIGKLALALELASQSIAHTHEGAYDRDQLATAYLFRGEAHLLSGAYEAAQQDLERAYAFDSSLGKVRWLLGLLNWHQGKAEQAEEWRQKAIKRHERYAKNYADAQSTAFLHKPATVVDWDHSGTLTVQEKDQVYWLDFMRSSVPESMKRVPVEFRNHQMCMEVLLACGPGPSVEFVRHFPSTSFSREMAENIMQRSPHNLKYVPVAMRDYAVCTWPSADKRGFDISLVPAECIDYALCLHAVKHGEKVENLPHNLIDKALCLAAIEANCYNVQSIPAEFLEDDLYLASIASASSYFFDSELDSRYKTPLMLRRAIALDKRALETIHGHLFDASLYEFAASQYGQDADWPQIVARHSPEHCMANPRLACAEVCWSVFWNEAFILSQINKPDYGLSSWKIPPKHFTQAIAEAAFERDRIHLDYIPAQFVNANMVAAFVRSYPDMLNHIPLALRTKSICEQSVKEKAENIKFVPLAWRNKKMCIQAVCEDQELIDDVPIVLSDEVIAHLMQHHADQFDAAWLHLVRGDSAMAATPPNIAQAIADYESAAEITFNGDYDDFYTELAAYYKGYCHFLKSEHAQAQEWFAKTDGEGPSYAELSFDEPVVGQVFEVYAFEAAKAAMEDQFRLGNPGKALEHAKQAQQLLANALMDDAEEAEKLQERITELGLDEN